MIYFAHPMGTYNKHVETTCMALIQKHFNVSESEVINPNSKRIVKALNLLRNKAVLSNVMVFFYLLVDLSEAVVFLSYKDGSIGIGVWGEIKHAVETHPDMPIYRIDPIALTITRYDTDELLNLKILTMDETVSANKETKNNWG